MQPASGTVVREPTWVWAAFPLQESLPDLPPGADPLLRARAKVLAKRDEATELRTELARIGLVVRDDRKRQYVRVRR